MKYTADITAPFSIIIFGAITVTLSYISITTIKSKSRKLLRVFLITKLFNSIDPFLFVIDLLSL